MRVLDRLAYDCRPACPQAEVRGSFAAGRNASLGQTRLRRRLDRFATRFAGANADAVVHGQDKDLAIADLTRLSAASPLEDRVNGRPDERFIDRNLQLDLPQQIHAELVSPVNASLAFLPSEALTIHNGQPEDFDLGQSFLDGFQLARLDDGDDQLHVSTSLWNEGTNNLKEGTGTVDRGTKEKYRGKCTPIETPARPTWSGPIRVAKSLRAKILARGFSFTIDESALSNGQDHPARAVDGPLRSPFHVADPQFVLVLVLSAAVLGIDSTVAVK